MARNRIHNYLDREREKMTERMWQEFVGNVLAMELDNVLSELDLMDMEEEQRERIRESF